MRTTLHKRLALAALAFTLTAGVAMAQDQKTAQTPPATQQSQTTAATQTPQSQTTQPAASSQSAATTQTNTTAQTPATTQTGATQPAAAVNAAHEPLYREFKGVRLGMSADDVRRKLGKPQEKSDEMDFYVFSNSERARIYYDKDKKAQAIITTYIGRNGDAPLPAAVLGSEVEGKADGSAYKIVQYPQAGYWVAYSRTGGDTPMVIITMQKTQ